MRLQEFTGALAAVLDAREVAAVVATRGREAVGAAGFAVLLRRGDRLELAGYDGPAEHARPRRHPTRPRRPAAEAVRTGAEIVLDDATLRARYPEGGAAHPPARRGPGRGPPADRRGPHARRDRPAPGAGRAVRRRPTASCSRCSAAPPSRLSCAPSRRSPSATRGRCWTRSSPPLPRASPCSTATCATSGSTTRWLPSTASRLDEHPGRTLAEIVPDLPDSGATDPLRQRARDRRADRRSRGHRLHRRVARRAAHLARLLLPRQRRRSVRSAGSAPSSSTSRSASARRSAPSCSPSWARSSTRRSRSRRAW